MFGHHERHRRHAIKARRRGRFHITVFAASDVADLHYIAVAAGDRDLTKLRGIGNSSRRANRKILCAFFQSARGEFQILRPQRAENIRNRQVVGAQLVRIHQHVDLAARAPHNPHLTHARCVLQFLFDQLVRDHREIAQRPWRGNHHLQHRRRIRIELLHDRHLGRLRQVVRNQIDLVLYFLRRHIAVLCKVKRDHHQGLSF